MLLTTCPNCAAQFKVQPEQLNIRQGRVMCGRCRHVFNAFSSLTRADTDFAPLDDDPPAAPPAEPVAAPAEPSPEAGDPLFLRSEPEPMAQAFAPPAPSLEVPPPLPAAAQAAPEPPGFDIGEDSYAEAPEGTPYAPDGAAENPLLAPASPYRRQAVSRTGWWTAGALLLAVSLAGQAAYAYREVVIRHYPQLRPAYVAACEHAGCTVPWGRDENAIRIDASDLIEAAGRPGRIQLTATVANRGNAMLDLPSLELKLTDNANQVILSRVLAPREYLGRVPGRDEGLAAGAELYVNINIEVASRAPASGYGVRAFYP